MRKLLAVILSITMLLGLAACNVGNVSEEEIEVPSRKDARRAAEREYNMEFVFDDEDISSSGSKAKWVFISEDGTLEVTVTWKAKDPDEFDFDDRVLIEPTVTTETTVEEPTVTTTYYDPYDDMYDDGGFHMEIGSGSEVINLWSCSDELPAIVMRYIMYYPEFGEKYTVYCTEYDTYGGEYQVHLDQALVAGGDNAPDIYAVESDFAAKYTQGDMSVYAARYKDIGIDVDQMISDAEIAQYIVDVGTRDGDVVALAYQATGGAMIYRASIAEEVFGTSDPDEISAIVGGGSGNWDKFLGAAETLKDYGYSIVSGVQDIWQACETSNTDPWVLDGYDVYRAPEREAYLDVGKILYDEGYTNGTNNWYEEWYDDMEDSNVFCYLGPAWFLNYIMIGNCGGYSYGEGSYGDWRICVPPVGFFWGGTWVLANKDTDMAEGVAELIEWITLDTSDTGLQYLWANDLISMGGYDSVASGVVMDKCYFDCAFLGGQDMFGVYRACDDLATGKGVCQYDPDANAYFQAEAEDYIEGDIDRNEALQSFYDYMYEDVV